jgi:5-methylcytosine-specific restriction protein A
VAAPRVDPEEPPDTGPDFWTRRAVQGRFGGRCARCGGPGVTVHHRKPRGMGGTRDPAINYPSNLLWLCGNGTTGCHGWIEHNRASARRSGWLVPYGRDPTQVPVRLWDRRLVLLDNDGGWRFAPT